MGKRLETLAKQDLAVGNNRKYDTKIILPVGNHFLNEVPGASIVPGSSS